MLTHHTLKGGKADTLPLGEGEKPKLQPISEAGSGTVQGKEKVRLAEIIARVNDLFEGNLTDGDQLVYVNHALMGKLLESKILAQQAASSTKEQFANSPDLPNALMNAIIDAYAAHSAYEQAGQTHPTGA